MIYVKTGHYCFQSDIAKKLARTEKTIRHWLNDYSKNAFLALLEVKSGGNNSAIKYIAVLPESNLSEKIWQWMKDKIAMKVFDWLETLENKID